jgi:hypothetical protein
MGWVVVIGLKKGGLAAKEPPQKSAALGLRLGLRGGLRCGLALTLCSAAFASDHGFVGDLAILDRHVL